MPPMTVPSPLRIVRLDIQDFVLVERLDLELRPGLNVLSGGSGEGKTLVVRALEFLLAGQPYGRASAARWLRQGAAQARVEAVVEGTSPAFEAALRAAGVPAPPAGEPLVVRRALERGGRSRCEVGPAGAPVAVAVGALRPIGLALVEVFGQGQAADLTAETHQRELLDAAASLGGAARDYARARDEALVLARERDALAAEAARLEDDQARASAERAALAELAPAPGEYEALVEEAARLGEREQEAQQLAAVVTLLDDDEGAACDRLRQALGRLDRAQAPRSGAPDGGADPYEADVGGARQALEEALALASDAAQRVRRTQARVELDQERLEAVRERVASFRALARRLRTAPEALGGRWQELGPASDPAALAARIARLDADLAAARPELDRRQAALSEARRAAAPRLAAGVGRLLPELGLDGARFEAVVLDAPRPACAAGADDGQEPALLRAHPAAHGADRVTLLFAAGPTQPLGGLERASGGELARLFLALALETAGGASDVPLLVFDEVDQNVGARLGAAVGRCLSVIGRSRQVLAITHLATVAARADHHVRVLKAEGRTRAERLEGEARVDELALMIKGAPITDAAREQARELLREAEAPRPAARPRRKTRPAAAGRRRKGVGAR
ncbi:MAG: hypothetical protein KF878_35065 [Planctomycetes bacterium]|nr:hypothetical protein [Planctomycetota bacterium]